MSRPVVAFDVDGVLIDDQDHPRYDIVNLLISLSPYCDIIVWSGGGVDYAEHWVHRLGLLPYVTSIIPKVKLTSDLAPDVCFDDEDGSGLAKVFIHVPYHREGR